MPSNENPQENCSLCGKPTTEYCSTLACRDCHVAESLESCIGNVQVNEIRSAAGMGPL